jgi:hypothetical protein
MQNKKISFVALTACILSMQISLQGDGKKYFKFNPHAKTFNISNQKSLEKAQTAGKSDAKNFYSIETQQSLVQKGNTCAYHALYNTINSFHSSSQKKTLNQKIFDRLLKQWLKITKKPKEKLLVNTEILKIIKTENNPYFSMQKANNIGIIQTSAKFAYGYNSTHPTIYATIPILKIRDRFMNSHSPFYLIAHTGIDDTKYYSLKSILEREKLSFTFTPDYLLKAHWIALKFQWTGAPGKSPINITVWDSITNNPTKKGSDRRLAEVIHYYYWVLVH